MDLYVNELPVGQGRIPHSNPVSYGPRTLGFHIGSDEAGVWPAYGVPFPFGGTIEKVSVVIDRPIEESTNATDETWTFEQ